ncbi:hypothetical protein REPUB_Repub05bG0188800 [Reevesia pubescens]
MENEAMAIDLKGIPSYDGIYVRYNIFEVSSKYGPPIQPVGRGAHGIIVKIKDIIMPPEREKFNDVYIAYELMDTDLHQIIWSSQALTDDHCQHQC